VNDETQYDLNDTKHKLIDKAGKTLMDQQFQGQVFTCTEGTEEESFKRLVFGTNRVYAPGAMRVKKGDFLFLINLDSDLLHGVFKAASDAKINTDPEAWGGKYPYQVRVEPVGEIVSLRYAKKLLKQLEIKRSVPIGKKTVIRLLELYRPGILSTNQWFEFITETKAESTVTAFPKESKSWELLGEIRKTDNDAVGESLTLEATTLWDFPKQSYGKTPKGNNKYPGVTPAALIWNLVWRYTEPGDLVVDPMCGSGTTLDVCKEEDRRALCYDITPTRPDIVQNDARKIPLEDNSADLVFVDSPYGDNIRYNEHPDDIGKISSETDRFYDELEKVMKECHRILKPGKVLGWLIGDQWVKSKFTPVGFKLYDRLARHFETVDIICIARRGQASHTGIWYNRARRFNFFLRGFKYLFIMRKQGRQPEKTKPREIKWAQYPRENEAKS
jgi:DNA modification methylase